MGGPSNDTEQQRLDEWHGEGDKPFKDDPNNDGRFSDIECGPSGKQVNGYTGGVECVYADGTRAAGGIDYGDGTWTWGGMLDISAPSECPAEDSCHVVWDHENTMPAVEQG